MIMPYDPTKPYLSGEQYVYDANYLSPKLKDRVTRDVRTLCTALGYDINTVEFAIKDGVPYAIDFMNPAPDADLHSVGEFYHKWVTNAVTDLVFKRLSETRERPRYRWDAFLSPEPAKVVSAVASATEQAARTITPEPGREVGLNIVTTAHEPKSRKVKAAKANDGTDESTISGKKSSPRPKKTIS